MYGYISEMIQDTPTVSCVWNTNEDVPLNDDIAAVFE